MTEGSKILDELNDRSREVFRRVVEGYLKSGDPVGSRTLTRTMSEKVSAATIRNVMQDLEYLGLLDSPHISAGRMPTQMGLRMFVDGLLEVGDAGRGRPREDRRDAGRQRIRCRGNARPGRIGAFRPDPRRQPGARAEARSADPAYRIRQPRPRPRAGGAGLRRRPCGKPRLHAAARPDPLVDARGGEFPQRAGRGADAVRASRRRHRARSRRGGSEIDALAARSGRKRARGLGGRGRAATSG